MAGKSLCTMTTATLSADHALYGDCAISAVAAVSHEAGGGAEKVGYAAQYTKPAVSRRTVTEISVFCVETVGGAVILGGEERGANFMISMEMLPFTAAYTPWPMSVLQVEEQ